MRAQNKIVKEDVDKSKSLKKEEGRSRITKFTKDNSSKYTKISNLSQHADISQFTHEEKPKTNLEIITETFNEEGKSNFEIFKNLILGKDTESK